MSGNKTNIPDLKLAEFLKTLVTLPAAPAVHISDEDFAGYATDNLDEAETARVDAHIAICAQCCASMEELIAAADVWLDLDVDQQISRIRQHTSPAFIISSAVSAAVNAVNAVNARPRDRMIQQMLAHWASWINSLTATSFTVRTWKPISTSGFLAPAGGIKQGEPAPGPQQAGTQARPQLDIVLRTPTDLVFVEVPEGSPVSIRVTVKGKAKTDSVLVLMQQQGGGVSLAEAIPDPDLAMHTAEFPEVETGDYFVALSPGADEDVTKGD